VRVGESWEISDRPDDASVIDNGALAGHDLHWLMQHHTNELLGQLPALAGRFPLLIKLLDAQEKLSLQVHPPARKAVALGGEPKTEMWYIAHAAPGAELYVGLRKGVTRALFEEKIRAGTVAECFHRVPVRQGDAMFLPSGRVHAIGAGLVIFEIQQNSDTTYRVFDWGRVGLDGKPRALHIAESLSSIDFEDFEPSPVRSDNGSDDSPGARVLVDHPLFRVEAVRLDSDSTSQLAGDKMQILGVTSGSLHVRHRGSRLALSAGQFCLVPACLDEVVVEADARVAFLRVSGGKL
jgi:mannose-6-phosphate isomerase